MANQTVSSQAYHALLGEHRELMRDIAELRRWCKQLDEIGIPKYGELGSRLTELRQRLNAHFLEEESGGYLASALTVAPRYARDAGRLLEQHRELLQRLDEFIERLQAVEPPFDCWGDAHQELNDFLVCLRDHEGAENAILQAAFSQDVGTAD